MFLGSIIHKENFKVFCNFFVFGILLVILHRDHYKDYFDRAHNNAIVMDSTNYEYHDRILKNDSIQIENKTFYVNPNSKGQVIFFAKKNKGDITDLWINFPLGSFKNSSSILYLDSLSEPIQILNNEDFTWGDIFTSRGFFPKIRNAVVEAEQIKIVITAENHTNDKKPLVHWLKIHSHEDFNNSFFILPITLLALFVWILLSIVVIRLSTLFFKNETLVYFVALPLMSIFLLICSTFITQDMQQSVLSFDHSYGWIIFFSGLILYLYHSGNIQFNRAALLFSLLFCVLFSGKAWNHVINNSNHYLQESTDNWTRYAKTMELFTEEHGFFSANFGEREPFYVLVTHLWFMIFSETNFAHLNLTLLILLIYVFLGSYFLFRISNNLYLGIILGNLFYWQSSFLEPIQCYLRDPLFYLILSVFTFLMINLEHSRKKVFALSLFACLLILTRSTVMYSIILMTFGVLILKSIIPNAFKDQCKVFQFSLKQSLLLIFTMMLVWQPISLNIKKRHGSSDYWLNKYARWNANAEFTEKLGQPGFPSKEAWQKDAYAGPPITYFQYLFQLRTIPELINKNLNGLTVLLRHQFNELEKWTEGRNGLKDKLHILLISILLFGLTLEIIRVKSLMLFLLWSWYLCQNFYTFHLYPTLVGDRHVDHSYFTLLLIFAVSSKIIVSQMQFVLSKNKVYKKIIAT